MLRVATVLLMMVVVMVVMMVMLMVMVVMVMVVMVMVVMVMMVVMMVMVMVGSISSHPPAPSPRFSFLHRVQSVQHWPHHFSALSLLWLPVPPQPLTSTMSVACLCVPHPAALRQGLHSSPSPCSLLRLSWGSPVILGIFGP